MSSEVDLDEAARTELTGLKTEDMTEYLRDKFAPALRCTMCGAVNMNVIGTGEQLFLFSIPTFLTDTPGDKRKYFVSIVECGSCGYVHLFSPTPLLIAKAAKSGGRV